MRIIDARAMPTDHEDVIAVTSTSVYLSERRKIARHSRSIALLKRMS